LLTGGRPLRLGVQAGRAEEPHADLPRRPPGVFRRADRHPRRVAI